MKDSFGFTLLEVTLFLAISSGMAVIAFIGLGPRLRNARFTDAVRTTEASVNRAFSSTATGKTLRTSGYECIRNSTPSGEEPEIRSGDTPAGRNGACIVNGELVIFMKDKMMQHSLVSLREKRSTIDCATPQSTFESIIACYKPRIANGIEQPLAQSVDYINGVTAQGITVGGSTEFPIGFGYVQDPNSTNKYFFFFNTATEPDGVGSTQFITSSNSTITPQEKSLCLVLDNRQAKFTFNVAQSNPKVVFEGCSS